jgi:hypothetical protein
MIDVDALVLRWKKGAVPELGETHRATGTEDEVGRQVAVLRAESVGHPRAHARDLRGHRAVVHEEQGGTVVRIVGVAGIQHAEFVGVARRERQQFADRQTALAVIRVGVGRGHEPAGGALGAEIGALGTLSVVFRQGGLRLEKIGTKGAAVHEEMDHPFRPRSEVGARTEVSRRLQGRGEAERAEPAAEALQGGAPVDQGGMVGAVHRDQSR